MRCLRCDTWLVASHDVCPQCGLDLGLLRSLEELRSSVHRTQGDADTVVGRLRELERQVASLRLRAAARLGTPTAAAPEPAILEPEPDPPAEAPAESTATHEATAPPATTPPVTPPTTPPVPAAASAAPDRPILSESAEVRLGQKWLLIAGLVITVLAVGYFLKYSFDRNWIGPAGRVALAYAAGVAMLSIGEYCRRKQFAVFGLYLFGGGIAVLYFASYAAFQIYHLIGQLPAFGLMVVVTAVAGAFSLVYDTKWLAVLGIIGGFLTPVVLSSGADNQVALMVYMAILNGGISSIAAFKQWRLLNHLGMTFTWLLFSAWYVRHYAAPKFWPTMVFISLFFVTYAVVPFAYFFVRKSAQQVVGFRVTVINTFVAFGYSFATVQSRFAREWVSVVSIAYAVLFLGMAAYLHRRSRENAEPAVLLLTKGLLFLIITVPLLFSGNWITVFWAVQAIVLLWAALRLGNAGLRYGAIALLLIAAGKLFLHDYAEVFELRLADTHYVAGFATAMVERWVTILSTLGVLLGSAWMFKAAGRGGDAEAEHLAAGALGLFAILLFVALNIEVAACFHDYLPAARFASISVLWALYATALMVLGFVHNRGLLRRCAIVLFAATIIKVFLRDMANVDTPYRILSFLVLGLLLVGASYLYHRFQGRIVPVAEDVEA